MIIRDELTLIAVCGAPDLRIRITWKGSGDWSLAHGECCTRDPRNWASIISYLNSKGTVLRSVKRTSRGKMRCVWCRQPTDKPYDPALGK
jgi:hypothetical protein